MRGLCRRASTVKPPVDARRIGRLKAEDVALHAPNPEAFGASTKNWHIHIVETDRRMSIDSADRPVFGAKVRELTNGKQGKTELERRRAGWERRVKAELHRAGAKTRVTLGRT
ncbi:hypothetical protein NHN26_11505 [Rhodovulum tesquicola]|uniref:hypothetical protein n=1 Tax=Rhodovulum tesquicola TaxID=540254 RepID=UPI002098054F|nr:hypothetical protein [Rhodovulum tesquicola]MCO8145852.1 hypothetical protein [Rhodovulum tesquicola]